MTREEAIKSLQNIIEYWTYKPTEVEAAKMAIAALRPVSREQVERVWPGCNRCKDPDTAIAWERVWPGCEACKDAGLAIGEVQFYGPFEGPIDVSGNMHYCPNCGRPITPVAKDRQGKRLETLKDEKSDL